MRGLIRNKYFWCSFLLTLTVILTAAAILTVDYRCRKEVTGDSSALFTVVKKGRETELEVNALGIEDTKDITALHSLWEKFCDLICIPHN